MILTTPAGNPTRLCSIVLIFIFFFSWIAPLNPGPTSSYIIQGSDADLTARLVEKAAGEVTSRLPVIGGVGARLSPAAARLLKTHPSIDAIIPNQGVVLADHQPGNRFKTPETDYPDVVGADVVWQQGVTGQDVTVAVVDTGIGWHQDVVRNTDGKLHGRLLGWVDFVDGFPHPRDPNGHGTHIAGIIASSQLAEDGEWSGVAPGASLVGVRVLDETGQGTYEKVIQGIQWVLDHKDEYNIRVMNLSLVSPVQSPYFADPLNHAVMRAWAEGIVVVAAAGNGGPGPMTIGVPGNNPYVITSGAFSDNYTPSDWSDDFITSFSAAGPTLDAFVKPDVVAPGAHIVSTMMPSSYLAEVHQANRLDNHYFSMAGTSQAAAVTSGIAALMLSHNPELTPDQVKYRLMISSLVWIDPENPSFTLYSMWQQGAGRVNAPDAVSTELTGSANWGMNVLADLAGSHYQGYTYYDDDEGVFRIEHDPSGSGGFGTWAGGYDTWAGGFGTWAGGFGTWAGGFGTWAGGFGTWAGGFGTWAGGFGTWAGGFGTWAGGFGTWAGGFGTWAGNVPWSGTGYAEREFVESYLEASGPTDLTTQTSLIEWVEEP